MVPDNVIFQWIGHSYTNFIWYFRNLYIPILIVFNFLKDQYIAILLIVYIISGDWYIAIILAHTVLSDLYIFLLIVYIISADRYIAVCHPISSPRFRTPFIARIVSLSAWLTSALLMVPVFLYANTITRYTIRTSIVKEHSHDQIHVYMHTHINDHTHYHHTTIHTHDHTHDHIHDHLYDHTQDRTRYYYTTIHTTVQTTIHRTIRPYLLTNIHTTRHTTIHTNIRPYTWLLYKVIYMAIHAILTYTHYSRRRNITLGYSHVEARQIYLYSLLIFWMVKHNLTLLFCARTWTVYIFDCLYWTNTVCIR